MNKPTIVAAVAIATLAFAITYLIEQREPVVAMQPAPKEQPPRVEFEDVAPAPFAEMPRPMQSYPSSVRLRLHSSVPDQIIAEVTREQQTGQRDLAPYFQGISQVAPLSAEAQRTIAGAQRRHRKTYDAALRDAGLERETLSAAEREYAHTSVRQALDSYRSNFLMEVRPLLTEEQYALLSAYEATEQHEELARLQMEINAK